MKKQVDINRAFEYISSHEIGCHRADFNFRCAGQVKCPTCPMLEESYRLLINEYLDEESALALRTVVENSPLFKSEQSENGETNLYKTVSLINYFWEEVTHCL